MTSTLFTKPDCPFCIKAKRALSEANISFEERDVTSSQRTADESVYFSGVSTVPQLFVGRTHVNGSDDISDFAAADGFGRTDDRGGLPRDLAEEDLHEGAQDVILADIIPVSDGIHTTDTEQYALLRFYKEFFGFWPNTFAYLHHWSEAYKLFVYCHNFAAVSSGKKVLGAPVMLAVGFATSNAHGCDYCQVHATNTGGDMALGIGKMVDLARKGQAPDDSPIGPYELALCDLAGEATTNSVSERTLAAIRKLAPEARVSHAGAEANIEAVSMIVSAFGFLNVFNDLIGVPVESQWASRAETVGIGTGRHGDDGGRTIGNLDHDLPQGGPTMDELSLRYAALVEAGGGWKDYALAELGIVPTWFETWPEASRAHHVYLYTELMQDRTHGKIAGRLKHLMARVSAIATGHDELAAIEAMMAHESGATIEQVANAYEAAKGRLDGSLFDAAETAALRFSWASAQQPLTMIRHVIQPALDAFDSETLVHLATVCGIAGLVQRFSAVARPRSSADVNAFMKRHGLERDTFILRLGFAEHPSAQSVEAGA